MLVILFSIKNILNRFQPYTCKAFSLDYNPVLTVRLEPRVIHNKKSFFSETPYHNEAANNC